MMKTDEALALVRNPRGHSEALVWEARITVCDRLEAAEQLAEQLDHPRIALIRERNELAQKLEAAERERDNWEESARHFANGQEFYQGIVRRIGEVFGKAARTSDDGSVQDDVLALRVPELVEALAAHVAKTTLLMNRVFLCDDYSENGEGEGSSDGVLVPADLIGDLEGLSAETPETSLARLILEKQAEVLESLARNVPDLNGRDVLSAARELRRQAEEKKS